MSDLQRPSDSAHPDEALAGLVDGTLSAAERVNLQAHLDGCERCRSEVGLAESAARALRSLPELDAPWGLGRPAIEESRKRNPAPRFRRISAVAGVAAAAILVAGLSIAVLRGPQGHSGALRPTTSSAPVAPDSSGAGSSNAKIAAPPIVRTTQNYSSNDIAKLATDSAKGAAGPSINTGPAPSTSPVPSMESTSAPAGSPVSSGPSGGTSPKSSFFVSPSSRTASSFDAAGAVSCIDAAAGLDRSALPVRVIEARFEEKPALIGIFLNGPGAGQPANLVVVWVSSTDCEFLSYASHRITP
jgi:Putative zinc-finger